MTAHTQVHRNKGEEHSFMDWTKTVVNKELLEENESDFIG